MSQLTLQRDRQRVDYGYEPDGRNLHPTIEREKWDGRITIKPFSLWVLVVCGLAFFLAGFFSGRNGTHFTATSVDRGNPPPSQSTLRTVQTGATSANDPRSTAANASAPAVVHVAIKNMKFDPATVEVKSGDTVEWKNEDITPHTATAIPSMNSGPIASDQSWRHTYTEPGDFPYACTFHPEMKGTVIVK